MSTFSDSLMLVNNGLEQDKLRDGTTFASAKHFLRLIRTHENIQLNS